MTSYHARKPPQTKGTPETMRFSPLRSSGDRLLSSAAQPASSYQISFIAGLAAVTVLGLGRLYPHSEHLRDILWQCGLRKALHVPCPSCGITRVAVHLAHGELLEAFTLAPLPAFALMGSLGLGLWGAAAALMGTPGPDRLLRWLVHTGRGRVTGGLITLTLYGWTLVRFSQTGLP